MASRRSRGDGGLHWDARRERWIASVTVGYTPAGKRIVKRGSGRTKTEAKNKLKEILRDHEDGLTAAPHAYTVAQAVADWLTYGLSGRDANTAHVATVHGVDDPAQGRDEHALHRDPVAVLARLFDTSDHADAATRSALVAARRSGIALNADRQSAARSLPSRLTIGTSRRRFFKASYENRVLSEIHSSLMSSCSRGTIRMTSGLRASTRILQPTASRTSIDSVLRSSQGRAR